MPRTIHGDLRGDGLRVVVVVSLWNRAVTDRLRSGALEVLKSAGVADGDVTVVEVPGAFELPQAAAVVANENQVDAVVALGCLVKGETEHDRIIADACAKGLMDVSLFSKIPVTFGVITAHTQAQAEARSRKGTGPGKGGHKGREAAEAAIRLAQALAQYGASPETGSAPGGAS